MLSSTFCITIHDSQLSSQEKYTKLKLAVKGVNVVILFCKNQRGTLLPSL